MREKFSFLSLASVVLALLVPEPTLARSRQTWQGIETSHFAVYTGSPNKHAGRDILNSLETARIFFENSGLAAGASGPQLNILAFDSVKDAGVYRINPAAYAFYQHTREGDFVVMRDLAPEHFPVAIHEYTHYVIAHAGLKLPLWLNEGLADLYSTVESQNAQVILGVAPRGRENILSTRRWLDWADLAAVEHDSAYYRHADKMLLFYSQSWALVHMLALDSEYQRGFNSFLLAVSGGATTQQAMLAVYHKSLAQIGRDVQAYVRSKRMTTRILNMDVRLSSLETEKIADAGRHVELALAEILAASPQLAQEGNSRLASLAMKYPADPSPEESRASKP